MSVFGNRQVSETERELIHKINQNLKDIAAGKFRREPKEEKKSELERASAEEIQSGFIVLEARRIRKELHRLLMRKELKDELLEYAEDLQSQLDDYDAVLEPHSRSEQSRFVRLWNKSRKVKYRL
jgi:hypothetical protein